jgi:hypothetical protein
LGYHLPSGGRLLSVPAHTLRQGQRPRPEGHWVSASC